MDVFRVVFVLEGAGFVEVTVSIIYKCQFSIPFISFSCQRLYIITRMIYDKAMSR